jgi:IclR family mhp operon transcriptional activator
MRNGVIEPVSRAFALLEALNKRPTSSVKELNAELALPKPTIVRLLGALAAAGYVEQVSRAEGYRLTGRVTRLARGFRHRDRVVDAAIPRMRAFTAEHGWGLFLATMEQGAMVIRASTVRDSPISTESTSHNAAFSALTSALGRAYLAWCPAPERAAIVATLATLARGEERMARDRAALDALLAEVRRRGYATSARMRGGLIGLAIPIMPGARLAHLARAAQGGERGASGGALSASAAAARCGGRGGSARHRVISRAPSRMA